MAFKFYVGHQIIGHVKGDVRAVTLRIDALESVDDEAPTLETHEFVVPEDAVEVLSKELLQALTLTQKKSD